MKRFLSTFAVLALVGATADRAAAQYPPQLQGAPGYHPAMHGAPGYHPAMHGAPGYHPAMHGGAPAPGYGVPPSQPSKEMSPAESFDCQYGYHPALKRMFHLRSGCGKHGHGILKHGDGHGLGGWLSHFFGKFGPPSGGAGAGAGPGPTGGTLAFPHHPFARSPRDFFMYENGYDRGW
jgi:hypothetical protein